MSTQIVASPVVPPEPPIRREVSATRLQRMGCLVERLLGADRERAAFLVATCVLVLLTAALRLTHLTRRDGLLLDELRFADTLPHPVGPPTVATVLALRPVVVLFAAANCALVVAIARRWAGRRRALIAGVLYALDPFVVLVDSRLLPQAPTMTAAMTGLVLGLAAVENTGRRRTLLLIGAGTAFGLAALSEGSAVLVTTLPFLVTAGFGPSLVLVALAAAAVAATVFDAVRSRGRSGRHALTRAVQGGASHRMLSCWLGGVLLAVGWSAAVGGPAENAFALIVVPSTVVVVTLAARLRARRTRWPVAAVVVVVSAWSGQIWWTLPAATIVPAALVVPAAATGAPAPVVHPAPSPAGRARGSSDTRTRPTW